MFLGVGTENEYLGWKMKSTLCIGNQTSEIQILFTGFGIENESLGRKMKVFWTENEINFCKCIHGEIRKI